MAQDEESKKDKWTQLEQYQAENRCYAILLRVNSIDKYSTAKMKRELDKGRGNP